MMIARSPMRRSSSFSRKDGTTAMNNSTSCTPPLSDADAHEFAIRLRDALKPHTKDRKWRFKTYHQCFNVTHAINYTIENETNDSNDEILAVQRLNELITCGFLCHIVDPMKTIHVGETRMLYFRMVNDLLDGFDAAASNNTEQLQLKDGFSLINGKFGSSIRAVGSANVVAIQLRLEGVNHVLQETVTELNITQGELEMLRQEVLSLVSNQMTLMGIIFLLHLYIIFVTIVSQFVSDVSKLWWFFFGFLIISLITLTMACGMKCLAVWSDVDSKRIMPDSIETDSLVTTDDSGENIIQTERRSFMRRSSTSIVSLLSRQMTSLMNRSSFKKRSSIILDKSKAVFAREAYSLPDVEEWPHRPLFVCVNTPVCPDLKVSHYGVGACPIGVQFKFESDLFKGECLIRLKGSKSDDPQGDEEYFSGRKRIFQSVIQGQFKEKMNVADVLTGHEFIRPLKNLPHPWVLKTATNFICKISPGANIQVHTDQPFVEAVLAGSSQVVRGDMPGNEPNLTCKNIIEDCSVLGGVFSEGNVSVSKRKRILSNPTMCAKYSFDCDTMYTFEFYQNLFDASTYSLDLGFTRIGCSNVLNGQPIQWLGKHRDGRYLWSFQIWHEKLLKVASSSKQ